MASCATYFQGADGKFGERFSYICWAGVERILGHASQPSYNKFLGVEKYLPPGAKDEFDIKLIRCVLVGGDPQKEYKQLAFNKCREWFGDNKSLPFDEWEESYMSKSRIDVPLELNAHAVFGILTMLRYPYEQQSLLKKTEEQALLHPEVHWDVLFFITHISQSHNSHHGMFEARPGILHKDKTLRDCFNEDPLYRDTPENSLETVRKLGGTLHDATGRLLKSRKSGEYTIHCTTVEQFLEKLYENKEAKKKAT